MPWSKSRWGSVDVDTRVRQSGWIGPFGVASDEPPADVWFGRDEPTDAEEREADRRAA